MKGRIYHINEQRGMVAVETDGYDFSIFELMGGTDFQVGDEVDWVGDFPLGSAACRNVSRDSVTNVFFQDHSVHVNQLRQRLPL